jgi:hypothetical protein
MPVKLFRVEEGWVQVDCGTGTTIPVPRSKYEAQEVRPPRLAASGLGLRLQ